MRRTCPRCAAHRPGPEGPCPVCGAPPPPADRVTSADQQGPEDFPSRGVVLPADDPDAPTYLRAPAVPDLQSQWVAKAGRAGAWTGLGCGGLFGGLLLALELHEGKDVLRALVFLVAGAPVSALAGALAFSCLATCLEAPVAALAQRFGRQRPVRVPARSALRRTDALAGRAPGGSGETAISGPPDDASPKARDEIQRSDALERREE